MSKTRFPNTPVTACGKSKFGPDPYTLVFVYRPDDQPRILSGWLTEVKAFLATDRAWIAHFVFFKDGRTRGYWQSSRCQISRPTKPYAYGTKSFPRQKHWRLRFPAEGNTRVVLRFRQMPKAWVAAYDEALELVGGTPEWAVRMVIADREDVARGMAHFEDTFYDRMLDVSMLTTKPVVIQTQVQSGASFFERAFLEQITLNAAAHPPADDSGSAKQTQSRSALRTVARLQKSLSTALETAASLLRGIDKGS